MNNRTDKIIEILDGWLRTFNPYPDSGDLGILKVIAQEINALGSEGETFEYTKEIHPDTKRIFVPPDYVFTKEINALSEDVLVGFHKDCISYEQHRKIIQIYKDDVADLSDELLNSETDTEIAKRKWDEYQEYRHDYIRRAQEYYAEHGKSIPERLIRWVDWLAQRED